MYLIASVQFKNELFCQKLWKKLSSHNLSLSKRVTTADPSILLDCLKNVVGIQGKALYSDLNQIYNKDLINNFTSSATVSCGVPQGSILGPLLFLLYVNDIVNVSSKVELILFADDTNVFIKGNNIDECIRILNIELSKIHQWLSINKLSLNVQKTSYIVFNSHRSCSVPMENIYIDNVIVDRVNTLMFLGVKLNSKSTWNDHVLMIKRKKSKILELYVKYNTFFTNQHLGHCIFHLSIDILHIVLMYGPNPPKY